MRRLALGLLVTALAACVAEEAPISTGSLEGDEPEEALDAADPPAIDAAPPGVPDATPVPDARPPIPETLDLAFDTTSNGGQYSPKNIVAVWVEGPGGFVKTIGRWAGTRRGRLIAWIQASGGGDADAVSGATRSNHNQRLSVSWDFRDKLGQLVPDGTYTIRLELADRDASSPTQNRQGSFTVVKNGNASSQTGSSAGFQNASIEYSGR